ncbi:hypothetical protein GT030_26635 [Streptomyces sp. SID1328]|uniref:hypothetical protein n=1 Tax=Streptomyces sp. SID1328 TaxID=2690250 RepID=UPI00136C64C5|nr:hypothetical protein [Streptomyces sp. SID1328]MYV42347.1 hypothetical protein [Streptomyces sp. SID1328]
MADIVPDTAEQATSVLLTFTRGLEGDLRDVEAARRDIRAGARMINRWALPPA